MRFGFVHRLMTNALAVIGLMALVTSGKLHPVMSGATVVLLAIALLLPERLKQETFLRLIGIGAPLLLLAIQLVRMALGADPIPATIEFAALLQVIRLLTRRGAAHDHQVILLALLHLVAGTILGGGLTYALTLVGFLVLTPGAMVLSHLRREVEGNYRQGARDRTGMPVDVPRILRSRRVIGRGFLLLTCSLSLPVFLFTALLFVMFPRMGLSWLVVPPVQPERMVGFSERVNLGGVGTMRTDPTLVLRVRPGDLAESPPVRRNFYLRGAIFDTYASASWSRSPEPLRAPHDTSGQVVLRRAARPGDRVWHLELEPLDPAVVFVPGETVTLQVLSKPGRNGPRRPNIFHGTYGELRYENLDQKGLVYDVFMPPRGLVTPERTPKSELHRYLKLPASLSPRVVELASEMSEGAEQPLDIARALEVGLRTDYRYDLSSPSGAADDPLDHFLFESKAGHCEYYSTAMAMMLRVRGVPSRNVTGFVGGTYNRFGEFYAVRQGDAHSWVEAYLPRLGWTRFDPTPPSSASPHSRTEGFLPLLREMTEAAAQSWNQNVETFNLEKQVALLRSAYEGYRRVFGESRGSRAISNRLPMSPRRIGLLAAGLLLIAAGIYWYRRERKRAQSPSLLPSRAARRSIGLYQKLERALAARGVPRPTSTPPRTHAEALIGAGHPVGPEALALTDLYLGWRYGGEELTLVLEQDFLRRAESLRKPPRVREDQAA